MPNTISYDFGDVLLVSFPFTDQQQHKQRPAIVISSAEYHQNKPDVIIMAITSRVRSPLPFGETLIQDWQGAGLLKNSVMKPIVATIEQQLVIQKLGALQHQDLQMLREVLNLILG